MLDFSAAFGRIWGRGSRWGHGNGCSRCQNRPCLAERLSRITQGTQGLCLSQIPEAGAFKTLARDLRRPESELQLHQGLFLSSVLHENRKGVLPGVSIMLLNDDPLKAPWRLLITCFHGYERAPSFDLPVMKADRCWTSSNLWFLTNIFPLLSAVVDGASSSSSSSSVRPRPALAGNC